MKFNDLVAKAKCKIIGHQWVKYPPQCRRFTQKGIKYNDSASTGFSLFCSRTRTWEKVRLSEFERYYERHYIPPEMEFIEVRCLG